MNHETPKHRAEGDSGFGRFRPLADNAVPERVEANLVTKATGQVSATAVSVGVEPTQVRRPWKATARTAFQALVALAVLFPVLVETAGLDPASFPWLGGAIAVAAAVARVMALPQVEQFLRRFAPFLSAAPNPRG